MLESFRITIAQTNSTASHDTNIALLEGIVTKAVADKSDMIALPEVVGLMDKNYVSKIKSVKEPVLDPFLMACKRLAHFTKFGYKLDQLR